MKKTMTIIAVATIAAMTACQSSKEANKAEATETEVIETAYHSMTVKYTF